MPRLNKVTLVDRQYPQSFVSKAEDYRIPSEKDLGERIIDVNVAETYPEDGCTSIDQDCNWFLASGVIPQQVSSCQLGILNPTTLSNQPNNLSIIFPGSVTYEVRAGKSKRLGFKAWLGEN